MKSMREYFSKIGSNDFRRLFIIVKIMWYILLLILSSCYVIVNFDHLIKYNFFDILNLDCIVFLVWILLLIVPFIRGFEGFGVKFIFNDENTINEIEDTSRKLINDETVVDSLNANDIMCDLENISTERIDRDE